MLIRQNKLNVGLSAALTSVLVFIWWIFAKEIVLVSFLNIQTLFVFNEQVLTKAATEEICVATFIFSVSLYFLFLSFSLHCHHHSSPFLSISRFCYLLHLTNLTHVTAPYLSKVTYKDSNYQRYTETCSAAEAWDLRKITQQ